MWFLLAHIFLLLFSLGSAKLSLWSHCQVPPKRCPSNLINFYLYNSVYKDGKQLYLENETGLKEAFFSPNSPIKLVIHGYTGSRNSNLMQELRNAYFLVGTFNMIYVDWQELAKNKCYWQALKSIAIVGKCAAELLKSLLRQRSDLSIKMVHPIGFSLGAHIIASMSYQLMKSKLIFNRLTALDPAAPLVRPPIVNSKYIISRRHAQFVDSYHTNAGIFGVKYSNAHLDFYANGGTIQPNCTSLNPRELLNCSHGRAVVYYSESIIDKQNGFYAKKCSDDLTLLENSTEILAGEYCQPVPPQDEGRYMFRTNKKPPFAKSRKREVPKYKVL